MAVWKIKKLRTQGQFRLPLISREVTMTKKHILLLIMVVIIFTSVYIFDSITIEFTPQKWESNVYERKRMVESLLNKYDLYSMSREDVIKLLGTKGILEMSEWDYTYFLGKGFDTIKKLCISFDDNDMVESIINF